MVSLCVRRPIKPATPVATLAAEQDVPLRQFHVESSVIQYTANVTVKPTFFFVEDVKEDTTAPIEASFKFPLPTLSHINTAVCGFEAKISHLVRKASETAFTEIPADEVKGVIKPLEEAKELYNDSIAEGKQFSAMVEQTVDKMKKIFDVKFRIAPFQPEEKYKDHIIKVAISVTYVTEVNIFNSEQEGVPASLKFVIPSSVFPKVNTQATSFPFEKLIPAAMKVATSVQIEEGISNLECTSHNGLSISKDQDTWTATLESDIQSAKDFELLIRPNNSLRSQIIIEQLTTDSADEKFALSVPIISQFEDDTQVNSDFVFLVDCSGSMSGNPIAEAARTVKLFLQSMPEGCYFNIYRFGSSFESLFSGSSKQFDDTTLEQAKQYVNSQMKANLGGTELYNPMKHILQNVSLVPGFSRQVFVITDGEVSNPDEVIRLVRGHHGDTRVFSFGIGSGCDKRLVSGLAEAGEGFYEFISYGEKIEPKVIAQLQKASLPSWTNISLEWQKGENVKITPCYSRIAPVFNQTRGLVYAFANALPSSVQISATSNTGKTVTQALRIAVKQSSSQVGTLHKLAAQRIIKEVDEYQQYEGLAQGKQQALERVKQLALRYNLMSSQTSFIAVSDKYQETSNAMPAKVFSMSTEEPERASRRGLGFMALKKSKVASAPKAHSKLHSTPLKEKRTEKVLELKKEKKTESLQKRSNFVVPASASIQLAAAPPAPSAPSRASSSSLSSISITSSSSSTTSSNTGSNLDQLLFSQTANGSWTLSAALYRLLNITEQKGTAITTSLAAQFQGLTKEILERVVATSLVIITLREKHAAAKQEWVMIETRALTFLKKNNAATAIDLVKKEL